MSKKQSWSQRIAMSCKDELDNTKGESIERVEYGIAILTLNLSKTMLLLLLTLWLGITQYTLVYILAIVSIRFFAFGIHLKNSWGCLLWGLADYIGGCLYRLIYFVKSAHEIYYLCSVFPAAGIVCSGRDESQTYWCIAI